MIPDVIAIGRIGIDLYPAVPGSPLEQVDTLKRSLGGSPTNVAVGVARLGHSCALITRVGDDPLGRYARSALEEFGVDTRFVGVESGFQTPIAIAEIIPPDHFPLWFYRSPSAPDLRLAPADVLAAPIAQCRLLWITGGSFSAEPSASAIAAALRARQGGTTVLDLDHRPSQWASDAAYAAALRGVIGAVTVVVGNESEFRAATGLDDPLAAARSVLERGAQLVALKRGPQGVTLLQGRTELTAKGFRVPVVCGLGAGDAFGAALCHGLLEGWGLEAILTAANAAGAIVASELACAAAMPTRAELDDFIASRVREGELRYAPEYVLTGLGGESLLDRPRSMS